MCRPETKQTYAVLKAFDRAGGYLYSEDLEAEVAAVLKPLGYSRISELGPLRLSSITDELILAKATDIDSQRRHGISKHGKDLMSFLKGYVSASSPALVND